jgi:hypothetical protein
MSNPNPDHHVFPFSNVKLLLGEYPIRMVDGRGRSGIKAGIATLSEDLEADAVLVGLRLSPLRELLTIRSGRRFFEGRARKAGWEIEESVAVFPNLESDRFCFPISDRDSHRFLIRQILYPRRYSLSRRARLLLKAYRFLINVAPNPSFFYQATFVRVRRL